jgi:hypothetical protein
MICCSRFEGKVLLSGPNVFRARSSSTSLTERNSRVTASSSLGTSVQSRAKVVTADETLVIVPIRAMQASVILKGSMDALARVSPK